MIEVECEHSGKLQYDGKIKISDQELYNRCKKNGGDVRWFESNGEENGTGDGNRASKSRSTTTATAAVALIGTNCRPGETTVVVDETEYPFETYMTTFTVLPPEPTPEGV